MDSPPSPAVAQLQRWEDAGGAWRVISSSPHQLVVSLRRCDGGEEADRLTSNDAALWAYIGQRSSSEDGPAGPADSANAAPRTDP